MEFLHRGDSLERKLRTGRPRPSDELATRIESRMHESRLPSRRSFRYAVPAALTAAMVAALAVVGGVGYAATSVEHAAKVVAQVFVPAKQTAPIAVSGLTAGSDQYRPGYGWGDRNHVHTGPPGLTKKGGAFAPPLTPKLKGTLATLSTSFTVDEQAHLFISVFDRKTGKEIIIDQKQSKVGKGISGKPTKVLQYLVLVPRTIPLKLTLPVRYLVPGAKYAIRIIARDPQGNKRTLAIPFSG